MSRQLLIPVVMMITASLGLAREGNGRIAPKPGSAGKTNGRGGPLAALPSAPGAHIAKIKALGANQWLELGSPAADPKWGRACGRSWSGKAFALAPEIRGAYFTGEGPHAKVKPNGYGMDDYWVYDINGHRWVCIYPGTNVKTFNAQVKSGALKINENGVVVGEDGRVVVGHLMIHAWGFLTYDTDRCKFMALQFGSGFYGYYMPGGKDTAEGVIALRKQKEGKKFPPLTPLSYDTATGRFEYAQAANAPPGRAHLGGHPQFLYLSAGKKFLAAGKGNTFLYDPDKKSWARVKTQGPPLAGDDTAACYDPVRNRVYAGERDKARGAKETAGLVIFDVGTSTWARASMKGTLPQNWSHQRVSLHYDSANDVVLAFQYPDCTICVYDPKSEKWLEPVAMNAAFKGKSMQRKCKSAFYDPELNIHFVFAARDGVDDGVMWAYRYGAGKKK